MFLRDFSLVLIFFHRREPILLRVFNDILLATDGGNDVILVFTRLIAFATVGHIVLIFCLEHFTRINGTTLNWCKSCCFY